MNGCVKTPLQCPYSDLIGVLARADKTFTLKIKDQRQPVKVSVDRTKLATLLTDLADDKYTVDLGLWKVS